MYMVRFLCKFTSHNKVQITTFHLIVKCLQQQTMSFSYCVALMMDHVTFVIGELTCTCPRLVIHHKVTFIGLKSKSKIQIMMRYEWNIVLLNLKKSVRIDVHRTCPLNLVVIVIL